MPNIFSEQEVIDCLTALDPSLGPSYSTIHKISSAIPNAISDKELLRLILASNIACCVGAVTLAAPIPVGTPLPTQLVMSSFTITGDTTISAGAVSARITLLEKNSRAAINGVIYSGTNGPLVVEFPPVANSYYPEIVITQVNAPVNVLFETLQP